jgi:alpha-beta hydrolase superfamily lysophospholipase
MSKRRTLPMLFGAIVAVALASPIKPFAAAAAPTVESDARKVAHRTVKIDGLDISYREAGPKDAPTVLLLHGFPTSSHMFRNLIPALADTLHVVAPDYPGFGNSSMPAVSEFDYTFDNLARVMGSSQRSSA